MPSFPLYDPINCIEDITNLYILFSIYITGLVMFKIKEVAPIPGKTRFWKQDLKVSREYTDVLKGEQAENYAKRIRNVMGGMANDFGPAGFPGRNTLDHYFSMRSMNQLSASPRHNLMDVFQSPDNSVGSSIHLTVHSNSNRMSNPPK